MRGEQVSNLGQARKRCLFSPEEFLISDFMFPIPHIVYQNFK